MKVWIDIGSPDASYMDRTPLRPLLGDNWMEGQILFIDHFENIIVKWMRRRVWKRSRARPRHFGTKLELVKSV